MVAYEFKISSLFPVDAQTAGDELNRIYMETGQIEPREVVDQSRAESAPLHPCFEWNDAQAAEKYRESQAAGLIRNIVIVSEDAPKDEEPQIVRAFVNVQKTYQPMLAVINDPEKMNELLSNALRDLRTFQAKYKSLEAVRPVLDAIEKVIA